MIKALRQKYISGPLLEYLQRVMPPMSETERTAIESGDVWLDGDLFQGKLPWDKILNQSQLELTTEEQNFLDNEVQTLCQMADEWVITQHHGDLSPDMWRYIKKHKFFGLCIPKDYGGHAFSAFAHSQVITKLATCSVSTAVSVMVPNALGPAELLLEYGTKEQKQYYLPRLATGEDIPCFALTNPHAGSDAGAIPDLGEICKVNNKLMIKVSFDKHYITLAPIATLIGLAFYLRDPDNLLGQGQDLGITLALIPRDHKNLEIGNRHCPLSMAFMNGTVRGKDLLIPMDMIIGGVKKAGQGWRMLMEALSAGRGISLPSMSTGGAKLALLGSSAYAKIREQFGVSISEFEGIQLPLARMAGLTYMMESARRLTAHAVDLDLNPAIISGIVKYHLTEFGRIIINDAMDIHGGRGIQMGPNNYLAAHYMSMPISITVEGANILTRNLIIFGQGAMRCHPYLEQEIQAASENNLEKFDGLLAQHIKYSAGHFFKTLWYGLTSALTKSVPFNHTYRRPLQQMARFSHALAITTDIAMLVLGGSLKRREALSARLADVLSYLYLTMTTMHDYHHYGDEDEAYVNWALAYLTYQTSQAFDEFCRNFPNRWVAGTLRVIIFPWGNHFKPPSDSVSFKLAKQVSKPGGTRDRLTHLSYRDPNLGVGKVDAVFRDYFKLEPIYKIYKKAIKTGEIDYFDNINQQVTTALEKGIIDPQYREALENYLKAQAEVVRVDEFSAADYPREGWRT